MKLKRLKIKGFKNLAGDSGWFDLDFTDKKGITVLIGNNGSGKSNVLEAISAIFAGLYDENKKPGFDYELEYEIKIQGAKLPAKLPLKIGGIGNYKVTSSNGTEKYYLNNEKISLSNLELPSRVIAGYSGEELRLKEEYYDFFTEKFKKQIIKTTNFESLNRPLLYIDKNYWDIALVVFLSSGLDNLKFFIKDFLQIISVENIVFDFDAKKKDDYEVNRISAFVEKINPSNQSQVSISFEDFKKLDLGSEGELFSSLDLAIFSGFISNIEIVFNDNLEIKSLSEGEKKCLLVKFILEILADENSLVLFDEPDSHIHIGRKNYLKKMIEDYPNRDVVLTTHSPTLMHYFDDSRIVHVEEGSIVENDRADVLKTISGDLMSYSEQQILLNTKKDILIVEGKTDGRYIKTALEKLKENNSVYNNLDFEFLYLSGTDPEMLKDLIEKFPPRGEQTNIAFLDRDGAGLKCIKGVCEYSGDKDNFTGDARNGTHIYFYPKKEGFTKSDFEIEDYFDIDKCRDFAFGQIGTMADLKCKFKKNDFAKECEEFEVSDFDGFKKLFDLIIEIKNQP